MRDIKRQKSVELLRLMKAPSSPIHGRFQVNAPQTARPDCTSLICTKTTQTDVRRIAVNDNHYVRAA
jgi:hypothetical protein